MTDNLSELARMAVVDAAVEANNLLHYDETLDSSLVLAVTSDRRNIDAGATKHFVRTLKKRTNWRLPPDDRINDS